MSPKELLYLEDALGYEQFLKSQCQEAVQQLQDADLKNAPDQWLLHGNSFYYNGAAPPRDRGRGCVRFYTITVRRSSGRRPARLAGCQKRSAHAASSTP